MPIIVYRKDSLMKFLGVFGSLYQNDPLALALLARGEEWQDVDFPEAMSTAVNELMDEGKVILTWVGTGINGVSKLGRRKDAVYRLA